jgi:hypothetical protein
MTIIAREVWCYVTISSDMRDTSEKRNVVRFDGSSIVLLWWMVLHGVGMWSVKKESSWNLGNLFQTAKQSKINNKFHSQTRRKSKSVSLSHQHKTNWEKSDSDFTNLLVLYIGRWLRRWNGLHYPATWPKRFCDDKIIYKEAGEIFCGADPINGAWWM